MSPETRNLAWRLNWYRQSELEGALLLGRMVRAANDSFLVQKLTRHAADEARHAALWADAIAEAGLPTIRIFRSYQSLYGNHGGMPSGMQEVLAFTQIFERRVHKRFTTELHQTHLSAPARKAFEIMIADESGHLEWVLSWLRTQAESEALLQKISIDRPRSLS
jgi:bacterioferritin (cytochrome b1)